MFFLFWLWPDLNQFNLFNVNLTCWNQCAWHIFYDTLSIWISVHGKSSLLRAVRSKLTQLCVLLCWLPPSFVTCLLQAAVAELCERLSKALRTFLKRDETLQNIDFRSTNLPVWYPWIFIVHTWRHWSYEISLCNMYYIKSMIPSSCFWWAISNWMSDCFSFWICINLRLGYPWIFSLHNAEYTLG